MTNRVPTLAATALYAVTFASFANVASATPIADALAIIAAPYYGYDDGPGAYYGRGYVVGPQVYYGPSPYYAPGYYYGPGWGDRW